jgi:phosphotriesterase-related protein
MIQTVTGPLAAERLGSTCMHDHVLSDSTSLRRDGASPMPDVDRVTAEVRGYLQWNMLALADNLRLDDADLAVEELGPLRGTAQRAVVECSSWGLGPSHAGLPDISRRSGVTVVAAYGAYIPRTVPGWIAAMTEAELEEHFVAALQIAVPGASFRAGMLGIMGTTGELAARELEQLRAAARAAARTGAAMSVRLEPEARRGLEVLAVAAAEGVGADRVVFTNADEYMDAAYWDELAGAGAVLEMCFGTESAHVGRIDSPSDRERLTFFPDFVAGHPHARFVLGQSTWTKAQLRHYGGYGYDYLMRRIVPELAARGVVEERRIGMLVTEPARLLDRPA